jgi:hypothetical protein
MNLWPSRGLALHGFEFKVYRNDWLRELQNPAKAEPVAQYCDYWWVIAGDKNIVRDDELPETWGLMEVRDGKLAIVKAAPKKDAAPVSRSFTAALFRRLSEIDNAEVEQLAQRRVDELDASRRASFEQRVAERTRDYENLRKRVADFERLSGINLEDWRNHPEELGKAVRFVIDTGIFGMYGSVERLHGTLLEAADTIGKVIQCRKDGTEFVRELPALRRKGRRAQ